jgi:hypothetical protein
MSLPSLLTLIPPPAVYHRVPLDPRQNALELWREAIDKFAIPESDHRSWRTLAHAPQVYAAPIPPPQRKFAEEILRQNSDSLDALDEGLDLGKLQFQQLRTLKQITAESNFVYQLGEVARLHLIRFLLCFSSGELTAAGDVLFRLDKVGSMVCNGEGQILHYLVGLWLRAAAVRGYGRLASLIQTPKPVLERILETLDEDLKTPDGLAQSLRVDLATVALAQLDGTVEGPDLEQIVDGLLEVYYLPRRNLEAKAGGELAVIADGWLKERRRQILLLLKDHPKPFDKAATARLMGVIVAETVRDLNRARRTSFLNVVGQLHRLHRKMRLRRLASKTRLWPLELTPGMRIEAVISEGTLPQEEAQITTIKLPSAELSDEHLTALQKKIRRVDNPIGLMLAEHLMAHDYSPHMLDHLRMMKTMRGLIKQRLAM